MPLLCCTLRLSAVQFDSNAAKNNVSLAPLSSVLCFKFSRVDAAAVLPTPQQRACLGVTMHFTEEHNMREATYHSSRHECLSCTTHAMALAA
jgi:hypothetical protein